jgi:hypothetical protein
MRCNECRAGLCDVIERMGLAVVIHPGSDGIGVNAF